MTTPSLAQRSVRERARLISRTRPVAPVDPISEFIAASGAESRSLWLRPASNEALVGIGNACSLTGDAEHIRAVIEWSLITLISARVLVLR